VARTAKSAARRQPAGRNIELAKIHIGAAALGLIQGNDREGYLAMLWSVARVRSSKDLDAQGRERVLEHLRACGWADSKPFVRGRRPDNAQAAKIRALWHALHAAGHVNDGSERALRAYVQHQSATYHPQKHGYSAPELLPSPVAQRVIEHLKHWCRRTGTEA
jgi:phage gp16-like protein